MKTLTRLMRFAVPYWKVYLGTLVLILAITGLQLTQPMIVRWIVDDIYVNGRWDMLIWGALGIAGASLIGAVLATPRGYGMAWAGQKIIFDVRNRLYEHLQQLSFSFL